MSSNIVLNQGCKRELEMSICLKPSAWLRKQTPSDLLPGHSTAFHSALLPYRGYDFEGTTIGLAFLKSICSDIYSAGIIQV